ncbi:MAG: HNH endonuclease [Nitrosomonas sp.]|uniref:HNH endonuclease n=1 Tax=Nitrosomonas sp. TaxID=42353 RepID=UPI001E06A0F5|nr:HNH endonuclease [Nitrosomonas sp.]MBX9893556.1 HNH endonuclease [Nitrosomonas sp.]
MKYWVGVTDNSWYKFLSERNFDEVNFWSPSGTPPFTNLEAGTPFLFKLKRPNNHIAGLGYFVKYVKLPLTMAWEVFGEKNGAGNYDEFEQLVRPLMGTTKIGLLEIGCSILSSPIFFLPDLWIEAPSDWLGNIVRGKTYDTTSQIGNNLWHTVQHHISAPEQMQSQMGTFEARYGEAYLARARLGQGTFRVLVTEAYQRKCAITGEHTLPVLEAAHIKPYSKYGPNSTSNGLLLRSDFHKLFDLGLVTVTPQFLIEVSSRIKEEWFNGKAYYRLHGQKLATIPERQIERPSEEYLRWHNENVYVD